MTLAMTLASPLAEGADTPPASAYPIAPADLSGPDDGVPRRVPKSSVTYTLTQLRDRFIASDWHPEEQPPMPLIVPKAGSLTCSLVASVIARMDPAAQNSAVAGLPAAYIVQQMYDYKSGARTTAVAKRGVQMMIDLAKAATDEEISAAAAYLSALKPRQHTRVVETNIVPKTFLRSHHHAALPSEEKEAIGKRIIEVSEDLEQFMLHDSHARFIAYVPVGSVAKGEVLVKAGGSGKAVPCAACHGAELKGTNLIPGIAGRSTNYVVRQLYDFKHGFRAGLLAVQMKDVVTKLSEDDMLAIAAYLATQAP
jgi:cytochrome c553